MPVKKTEDQVETKIWYAVIGGKADGPHDAQTIREWLTTSKLNYSDLVFRQGLAAWVHISECKEFERRTTERMKSETVANFEVPPEQFIAGVPESWIALSKHGEGDGRHHYIQSGPFTKDQIFEKLKRKELKYDDHLWKKGFANWTSVAEVEDFQPEPIGIKTEAPSDIQKPALVAENKSTAAPKAEAPQKSDMVKPKQVKTEPVKSEPAKAKPAVEKSETVKIEVVKAEAPKAAQPAAVKSDLSKVMPMKVEEGKFGSEVTQPTIILSKDPKAPLPKPNVGLLKDKPEGGNTGAFHFGAQANASEVTPVGNKVVKVLMPLSPGDKSAPPSPLATGSKTKKVETIEPQDRPDLLEDPEIQGQDQDEEASNPLLSGRRKRLAIAAIGATLVMALVYAGMNAYKENLVKTNVANGLSRTAVPVPEVVAHLPAPPPPPPPKAIANGALPDPFSDKASVPVNPEVENPTGTAKVLRVVSLKTASDHPQLAMETDLPGGSPLHIEITAASGAILKYPSFKLVKDIAIQPGAMPSVDLSSDRLQSGDYSVTVKGGGLTAAAPLSVGLHDQAFRKALIDFRKVVAQQQKKEKAELKDGLAFVARSYASISKSYRAARNPTSADSKRKWTALVKTWKKDFEQKARDVKSYNERTRNGYAYPDQFGLLKSTEEKLLAVYRSYDNNLKSGRDIASDNVAPAEFKKSYKDLQKSMSHLK